MLQGFSEPDGMVSIVMLDYLLKVAHVSLDNDDNVALVYATEIVEIQGLLNVLGLLPTDMALQKINENQREQEGFDKVETRYKLTKILEEKIKKPLLQRKTVYFPLALITSTNGHYVLFSAKLNEQGDNLVLHSMCSLRSLKINNETNYSKVADIYVEVAYIILKYLFLNKDIEIKHIKKYVPPQKILSNECAFHVIWNYVHIRKLTLNSTLPSLPEQFRTSLSLFVAEKCPTIRDILEPTEPMEISEIPEHLFDNGNANN